MILLLVLVAVILIFAALLFTVTAKLHFHFDSITGALNVTLLWLYPFFRSVISNEDGKMTLSVYLFNGRVYKRKLVTEGSANGSLGNIKGLDLEHVNVSTEYGFSDPYNTGIMCGFIGMLAQLFPITIEALYQNPDFQAREDFISVDASAEMHVGQSLVKLV